MKLNDRTYDILKWVCLIVMPASAWLYQELGVLWGFPYVDEITKSINIVATFIGILLGVCTFNHNKEKFNASEELDGTGIDIDELTEELTEEELKGE